MNDKEILGELKQCYEYLNDIRDNADDEQLNSEQKHEIDKIIFKLAKLYVKTYKNVDIAELKISGENNALVSDDISADYIDANEETYFPYKELASGYKWWTDYNFLTE